MDEQRKYPRYDLEICARIKDTNGDLDVGVTKNMSQGGCLLATLTRVTPQELIFQGHALKTRTLSSVYQGGTWLHRIAFQQVWEHVEALSADASSQAKREDSTRLFR